MRLSVKWSLTKHHSHDNGCIMANHCQDTSWCFQQAAKPASHYTAAGYIAAVRRTVPFRTRWRAASVSIVTAAAVGTTHGLISQQHDQERPVLCRLIRQSLGRCRSHRWTPKTCSVSCRRMSPDTTSLPLHLILSILLYPWCAKQQTFFLTTRTTDKVGDC